MTSDNTIDDRFDPLAVALRTEADQIKAPASANMRQQVLADLERPLQPETRPTAFPVLASLAAAALLLMCILPFLGNAPVPAIVDQPVAAAQHSLAELPTLPKVDFGTLVTLDPSSEFDHEVAKVKADLAWIGSFIGGILPSNPSPLPLL